MASVLKYFFLFSFGGIVYVLIEMLWRGYSHWSMFILGGICFVLLGLINKKYTWDIDGTDCSLWIKKKINLIKSCLNNIRIIFKHDM